jgi:hypothetical protein
LGTAMIPLFYVHTFFMSFRSSELFFSYHVIVQHLIHWKGKHC